MEALEGGIGFAPMVRELQSRALVYLANHPKMAQAGGIEPTAARGWSSAD